MSGSVGEGEDAEGLAARRRVSCSLKVLATRAAWLRSCVVSAGMEYEIRVPFGVMTLCFWSCWL